MSDHDVASSETYTLHRILRGIPEGQTDMSAMQAFPMDSNLDVMGGRNSIHLFRRPILSDIYPLLGFQSTSGRVVMLVKS